MLQTNSFGFFTNTQNGQYWYYCQLCIPRYLQFPALFPLNMLVNVTLDITGYKQIIFQDWRLRWSFPFLKTQLKRSWQYWHPCIVESLWKNLLLKIIQFTDYDTVLQNLHNCWHGFSLPWNNYPVVTLSTEKFSHLLSFAKWENTK